MLGGWWGSTLGLAYAELHPQVVLRARPLLRRDDDSTRGEVGDARHRTAVPGRVAAVPQRRAARCARRQPRRGLQRPTAGRRSSSLREGSTGVVLRGRTGTSRTHAGVRRRPSIRRSVVQALLRAAGDALLAPRSVARGGQAPCCDAERLVGIPGTLIHGCSRLQLAAGHRVAACAGLDSTLRARGRERRGTRWWREHDRADQLGDAEVRAIGRALPIPSTPATASAARRASSGG